MAKPKIHFDTGRSNLMPMSGRHTITACGMWLQDSHEPNSNRKTKSVANVTCKNCLKNIEKRNGNGRA